MVTLYLTLFLASTLLVKQVYSKKLAKQPVYIKTQKK